MEFQDYDSAEFEKEFQEDNDTDDEFERKLQESYQVHREGNSRPESSSSNRPQTASRYRLEEYDSTSPKISGFSRNNSDLKTEESGVKAIHIYSKIAEFLVRQHIKPSELSMHFKEVCTFTDLKAGMERLGARISDEEVLAIFRDQGVPKYGMVRMSDIYAKIITEELEEEDTPKRSVNENVPETLREEAENMLRQMQPKPSRKVKKSVNQRSDRSLRSKSGVSRPVSAAVATKKSQKGKTVMTDLDRELENLDKREQHLLSNATSDFKRRNYLKETKQRQVDMEKELALTVDKCRREFEYDCLHKMGEANEIAQSMNLPTTFRAIKKEDGTTKCHIYHNDQFVEEITLDNFLREWRRLKRQQRPAINLPPPPAEKSKVVTGNGGAKVNKKERQEELKKLLLETKELTNKLKEQLKILEKKGIISKSMHSVSAAYSSALF